MNTNYGPGLEAPEFVNDDFRAINAPDCDEACDVCGSYDEHEDECPEASS